MAKQTTTPQVDEDCMKEIIAQGFPMKRERESEPIVAEPKQEP